MLINNKKVQGLYIYNEDSDNIEFTKGDLVVSGDGIYICDAEIISGIDPANDVHNDYYYPYPGSMIKSASEFIQYVKGGDTADRYVSSKAIMEILQSYQFGYNMEGVVEDYIDKNGDTTLRLSSITSRPLDNLILTESLNRGKVRVSHELDQIVSGVLVNEETEYPFSVIFGYLETFDDVDYYLILTQYTYKQDNSINIRIQELMSPLSGVTVYRYMSWKDNDFPIDGSAISNWRSVYSYSSAIESKLESLQSYYETLAEQFNRKVASLRNSFRFKEFYIGSDYEDNNSLIVSGLEEGVYVVCLEGTVDGNNYTESVTVRLISGMSEYSIYFNKLGGHLVLSSDKIKLELEEGVYTRFTSIYGRDIYATNNE